MRKTFQIFAGQRLPTQFKKKSPMRNTIHKKRSQRLYTKQQTSLSYFPKQYQPSLISHVKFETYSKIASFRRSTLTSPHFQTTTNYLLYEILNGFPR